MMKSNMKKTVLIFLMLSVFLSTSCAPPGTDRQEDGLREIGPKNARREELCFDFLKNEMITQQGGVRTNYLDKDHTADFATGAEVLSESMGLLMLYAVAKNDETLFQSSLGFIEEYLDTGDIIAYRYSDKGAYQVNAFVDDMRIIRALILADDLFGGRYLEIALAYADRLYQTNIEDHYAYDMYDNEYGLCNDFITLCYIDLYTMRVLGDYDEKWKNVFTVMREIVEEGYISDEFPMYASSYSYTSRRYRKGDINMIEAALTALNLARIDACPRRTLDYLKDSIRNGAIYGVYKRNGMKKSDTESTAIYAICALIAKEVEDGEMYAMCMDKMNGFQVIDDTSEVYGAFADPVSLDLYSFDNLMALLAYRQR